MADRSRNEEQLKALQRLSNYNERMQRLKRLWIDVNTEPPVRYAGGATRRPSSPSPTASRYAGGAPNLSTSRRREQSPADAADVGDGTRRSSSRGPSTPASLSRAAGRTPSSGTSRRREQSPRDNADASAGQAGVGTRRPGSPGPNTRAGLSQAPVRTPSLGTSRRRERSPSDRADVSRARDRSHGPGDETRTPTRPKLKAKTKPKPKPAADAGRATIPQGPLTAAQIRELMTRDLTPEDYELLLLLDEGVVKKSKVLSEECASALPRATGTQWIDEACPICLCALEEDEDVRMLPTCGHFFHAPCAQRWLTGEKATCPLCGSEESKQDKIVSAFRRFDTNGDGMVELADMKTILKRLDAGFWDDERITRLFQAADVDHDGRLCASDFVNWLCVGNAPIGPPPQPELERGVTRSRVRAMVESEA